MKHSVDTEFLKICQTILSENFSEKEWSKIEASDMFQSEHYCGGYDAIENAFCFSYFDKQGKEWWFQLTLEEVQAVLDKQKIELKIFEPPE